MIKVMMSAPFEVKGRYRGGISTVVNAVLDRSEELEHSGIQLIPFNTCRVNRHKEGYGRLNPENLQNFFQLLRDVDAQLRQDSPDVFYSHSSVRLSLIKDLLVLRRVKKKAACKTVLHIHSGQMEQIFTGISLVDSWIQRALRKHADAVVLLSKQTLEQFVQLGIPREKCHLLYNFTSMPFSEEALFPRERDRRMRFLFAGLITESKGIFDALAVFQEIDASFVIDVCGDYADLKAQTRFGEYAQRLGERLQFHGFVTGEEKHRLFRDADVLLLPSYGEGLPMVLLEAFSAGCGVIVTDVGAVAEIMSEENGIVIRPGDLAALKAAIEHYLSMDSTALQAQQRHNYRISKQYSLEVFLHKLAQICKDIRK